MPNIPGGPEDDTPLHEAASGGWDKVAKVLIEFGAKKEELNAEGKSPM